MKKDSRSRLYCGDMQQRRAVTCRKTRLDMSIPAVTSHLHADDEQLQSACFPSSHYHMCALLLREVQVCVRKQLLTVLLVEEDHPFQLLHDRHGAQVAMLPQLVEIQHLI